MSAVFSIQTGDNFDRRAKMAVYEYCEKFNISYEETPEFKGGIPVGTIEYCRTGLNPHFYPALANKYISRKIKTTYVQNGIWDFDLVMMLHDIKFPVFAKDASKWKNDNFSKTFSSKNELLNAVKLNGVDRFLMHFSEVVDFRQEWRYYVYRGNTITTGWYAGEDDDEPAPFLAFDPALTGAIDVGRLANGRMELVEMHAPFACGWYGDRHNNINYGLWQHLAYLDEYGR